MRKIRNIFKNPETLKKKVSILLINLFSSLKIEKSAEI